MKKKYEKPIFMTESFQLDTAYASTCREDAEASNSTYIKLGYNSDGCEHDSGYFSDDNCALGVTDEDDDPNNTVCYHGPIAGVIFINS